jgi:hypothetical protein
MEKRSVKLSIARTIMSNRIKLIMLLHAETNSPAEDSAANLKPEEIKDSLGVLTGWDLVDGHHLHKAWTF